MIKLDENDAVVSVLRFHDYVLVMTRMGHIFRIDRDGTVEVVQIRIGDSRSTRRR